MKDLKRKGDFYQKKKKKRKGENESKSLHGSKSPIMVTLY